MKTVANRRRKQRAVYAFVELSHAGVITGQRYPAVPSINGAIGWYEEIVSRLKLAPS